VIGAALGDWLLFRHADTTLEQGGSTPSTAKGNPVNQSRRGISVSHVAADGGRRFRSHRGWLRG
jgi:hypothetical protein